MNLSMEIDGRTLYAFHDYLPITVEPGYILKEPSRIEYRRVARETAARAKAVKIRYKAMQRNFPHNYDYEELRSMWNELRSLRCDMLNLQWSWHHSRA